MDKNPDTTTTAATEDDQTQQTQQTQDQDQGLDREALETDVAKRLAAAFDEEPEVEDDETADDDDSQTPTDDQTTDSDNSEATESESEDDDQDSDDDSGEAAAEEDSDAPTLPEPYRRSLHSYGWTDEEINTNLNQLGDSFIKTAERIHQNRNTELQQWAETGRKARENDGSPSDNATGLTGDGTIGGTPAEQFGLTKVDAEKLKEEYGEDALIDQLAGPLNKAVDAINQIMPQVQESQKAAERAEIEKVNQQVEDFFNRDDIQRYSTLYGSQDQDLTEDQKQARDQLLDTAYNLVVGSQQLHNKPMSLNEALTNAHQIVSKDYTEQRVREDLKKKAKTRSRGRTQRPSRKKGSAAESNQVTSRSDLEKVTEERMRKAGLA